jgi:hypothetical protein
MATAYCLKCKSNREITNSRYETAANGVLVVKGECPICRTKIARLLGKPKEEGTRL